MRRATFVMASGLAAAVLLAGALLYFHDSLPSAVAIHTGQIEAAQPQEPPPARTDRKPPDSDPKEGAVAQDQQSRGSSVNDQIRRQRRPEPDEATVRANMRKDATQSIRESYSLLLEHLDVPPEQRQNLEALLTDMLVEGMWTGTSTFEIRGREIPQQERYERIASVIGDQKLVEFLALEQNVQAYAETTQIERLLRRKDVPLTDPQRDGVFEILVDVHARYPYEEPPAELDRRSDEYIDDLLRRTDDVDRHVIELAPSALSPTQVAYLSDAYDFMSRDRRSDVEMQKKRKAAGDPLFMKGGWMTPGRWPAEVMRD
jgi:hypothetical protein